MADLFVTLVGEGTTDAALLPIAQWLLADLLPDVNISGYCANEDDRPSARNLTGRIVESFKARECHMLFVHRDADTAGRDARVEEIERAAQLARSQGGISVPIVPIIPIRMLEAWLLTDEEAIRQAAGNPNGRMPLSLPRLRNLERLPNPKGLLEDLIRTASGLSVRQLNRLEIDHVAVAEATESFERLRQLPAFQTFENDVKEVIRVQGWPERLP